jgi:hypothetical protein
MPKAERQEETFDEQTVVRPVSCRKCRDEGWWVDGAAQQRGEKFFFYCDCKAGVRVQEEDEGGD